MKKITPVGESLLILPLPKENNTTDAGVIVLDTQLAKGKVMEVSAEFSETYKKGDIVIYAADSGISQYYRNQSCLWVNPNGHPKGHIFGIVNDEA